VSTCGPSLLWHTCVERHSHPSWVPACRVSSSQAFGLAGRQVRSVATRHKPLAAAAHHPSAASQPEFGSSLCATAGSRLSRSAASRWRSASSRRYDMPRISGSYLFLSQTLAVQATKKDSAPSISFASWRRLDHKRSHVSRRAPRSEE
jgi:hypothetical protein